MTKKKLTNDSAEERTLTPAQITANERKAEKELQKQSKQAEKELQKQLKKAEKEVEKQKKLEEREQERQAKKIMLDKLRQEKAEKKRILRKHPIRASNKSSIIFDGRGMTPHINDLKKRKASFSYSFTNTHGRIQMFDTGQRIDMLSSTKLGGLHLCNMVASDVRRGVSTGKYVPVYSNDDKPETVFFDSIAIQQAIDDKVDCFAIDINNCYWETARILGIISKRTYDSGMSNEDYKHGRRASLGALNSTVTEEKYVDGELFSRNFHKKELNFARVHIMKYIFDMALQIASEIPSGVCMYLTDCFFVYPDYAEYVYNRVADFGYEAKHKIARFVDLQSIKGTNLVLWDTDVSYLRAREAVDRIMNSTKINKKEKARQLKEFNPKKCCHVHNYNHENEFGNVFARNAMQDRTIPIKTTQKQNSIEENNVSFVLDVNKENDYLGSFGDEEGKD